MIDAGPSGLIVGAHLSDAPNDLNQLAPRWPRLCPKLGRASTVLVDQGYDNTVQIAQVGRERKLLLLCPPQRRPNAKPYNPKRKGRAPVEMATTATDGATFALSTLRALYRRRQPSAEAVFARIKTPFRVSSASKFGGKERPPANGCWSVWRITAESWPLNGPNEFWAGKNMSPFAPALIDSRKARFSFPALFSHFANSLPHSSEQRRPSPTVPRCAPQNFCGVGPSRETAECRRAVSGCVTFALRVAPPESAENGEQKLEWFRARERPRPLLRSVEQRRWRGGVGLSSSK